MKIIATIGLCLATSCSTIHQTNEQWPSPVPFKGVIADAEIIVGDEDKEVGWTYHVLAVIDFPFSLSADFFLLPLNLVQWVVAETAEE